MIVAAVFAMTWSVVRAVTQSVTLDEADTYFWFVANSEVFYPFPNNHVLNTVLIWISTHLFGLSSLTLRIPALLGGALYIIVCYYLCRRLILGFVLQFAVFLCLTLNPLVMDFMVAARGYSLALAFLMAAIAVPWWRPAGAVSCGLASLALGLSFTANFSFAFVDLAVLVAIVIWARKYVVWCVLPGLLVALGVCAYTLMHLKRGDLFYGAHSLGEMTRSLVAASLYHMNPRVGGSLYKVMRVLNPWLLPALGVLAVGRMAADWRHPSPARRFLAVVALAILLHWLAFRFAGLALPKSRTGIFLLPLCTLFAGAAAAGPDWSGVSRGLRRAMTAVFLCLACYFVLCLRSTYFKEYEYDRDVKDVYGVLAELNHRYGVTDVAASGVYASSLNFYRVASGKETFGEFKPTVGELPVGRAVYVIHGPFEKPFIEREKLVIIYRGKGGEVVVGVTEGLLRSPH